MDDRLTALDATFLELEQQDEGALMSIGGDGVRPDARGRGADGRGSVREPRATAGLTAGLFPAAVGDPNGRFAWPEWTDDRRFRIRNHVAHVALPAPGRQVEPCECAADFYSHRLDQTRPLWEVIMMGLNDLRFYTAPLQAAGAAGDRPKDGDLAQLSELLTPGHPARQQSAPPHACSNQANDRRRQRSAVRPR